MADVRHIVRIGVVTGLSLMLGGCAALQEFRQSLATDSESPRTASAQPAVATDAATSPPPTSSNQAIAVAALDPLNAPVPNAAAPAMPSSSDAMLLPAPDAGASSSSSSQRVPFGALSTPAAPVPLTPQQPQAQSQPQPQQAADARSFTPAPVVAAPQAAAQAATQPQPQAPPPVVVEKPAPMVTSKPAQIPTQFMVVPQAKPSDDEETVVISSATKTPPQAREFIPASVMPEQTKSSALGPGDMALTSGQKNVVQRFQTLRRLQNESLITEEEFDRRRNANVGALLPYTHDPAGVGLERSVPSADAISARLAALRRSFEMRAITAQQHALERTMILNALLPEVPEERSVRQPPPRDVLEGAAMVGYLEALRTDRLITTNEFDDEKAAIDQVLRTGLLPSQTMAKSGGAARKAPAPQTASVKPAAVESDPMTTEITGPVVHLASFSSEASARRGWDEVISHNKTILTGVKPIIRKVDLGEKGIFFRLMAGSYASMSAAEAACIQLKQNNQFCRASADGG